mmetsp:Transcript_7338/g.10400  ORF Transcript_7338/g.10400 Transcript_7338/m.10400 type:complete len:154 (+) Transcript_7338:133-594(+)
MTMNKKELLGSLELQLRGLDVKNTTTEQQLQAPFFEIATKAGNKWTTCYTSKPTLKDGEGTLSSSCSNPCWEPLTLALDQITKNGSLDSPIRITVKDSCSTAVDRWIGSFQTTVQELLVSGKQHDAFPIKQQDFFTNNCGMIVVQNAKIAASS